MIDGYLTCGHGIEFSFNSDMLIFFCAQTEPNSAACPWAKAMTNSNVQSFNSMNIY